MPNEGSPPVGLACIGGAFAVFRSSTQIDRLIHLGSEVSTRIRKSGSGHLFFGEVLLADRLIELTSSVRVPLVDALAIARSRQVSSSLPSLLHGEAACTQSGGRHWATATHPDHPTGRTLPRVIWPCFMTSPMQAISLTDAVLSASIARSNSEVSASQGIPEVDGLA